MSSASAFYRWRPHPWHGLEAGEDAPTVVTAYIEMGHYFSTYKLAPGELPNESLRTVYGHEHAQGVTKAAIEDYREAFGS